MKKYSINLSHSSREKIRFSFSVRNDNGNIVLHGYAYSKHLQPDHALALLALRQSMKAILVSEFSPAFFLITPENIEIFDIFLMSLIQNCTPTFKRSQELFFRHIDIWKDIIVLKKQMIEAGHQFGHAHDVDMDTNTQELDEILNNFDEHLSGTQYDTIITFDRDHIQQQEIITLLEDGPMTEEEMISMLKNDPTYKKTSIKAG